MGIEFELDYNFVRGKHQYYHTAPTHHTLYGKHLTQFVTILLHKHVPKLSLGMACIMYVCIV